MSTIFRRVYVRQSRRGIATLRVSPAALAASLFEIASPKRYALGVGDGTPDNRAKGDAELLESSRLLFEQAKYLLDDEIGYAESLRETRKTTSTLLAIVLGLGFFKITFFGSEKDLVLLVPVWAYYLSATILTLAVAVLLYGAWLLFSERSFRFLPPPPRHALEIGKSSAALAVLDIDRPYRKALEQSSPLFTVRVKTLVLQLAYNRLATANRRVRYRIDLGRKAIFLGLGMVFFAFLLYLWTIGASAVSQSGSQNDHAPATTQRG